MSNYNKPYDGPVGEVSHAQRRAIAESVVGGVDWDKDGEWGYCTCPGLTNHNHKNGRRDCRVFALERHGGRNGLLPPGVHCLHTSCGAAVEDASKRIRSLIGKAKVAAAKANGSGPTGPRSRVVGYERVPSGTTGHPPRVAESRTRRTAVFEVRDKQGGDSRTERTDVARPLTQFAHVRTHACFSGGVNQPSETSATSVAKPEQPTSKPALKAQPPPPSGPAAERVFHPTKLVWQTRAEWEAELQANPVKPTLS